MRLLGEPVFLEDFGIPDIVFFIFPDGTEGELGFGMTCPISPQRWDAGISGGRTAS